MLNNTSASRPVSNKGHRSDQVQLFKSANKRPVSSYKVKAEQLSALKQRIKQRNQNKQNNPMFRSDNFASAAFATKFFSMSTPADKGFLQKETNNINTISIDEFEIGDLLGKGAQAKVRMAFHKPTSSIYSIKTIARHRVQKNLDTFIRSLKIQMFLDHPNIAKIYGLIVEEKHVHLIMEYCIQGDLSMNAKTLTRQGKNLKGILHKVSQGLHHLHMSRIQHRDLKLENILLNCGVPKITDFQLSVYTKLDFFPRKTICGSPAYFCPQMIEKQRYNKKADIWCLGIVFYELLCGYFPFQVHNLEDLTNIINKQIKPLPGHLSCSAIDVINKMLCKQSQNRISIEEVIEHEFFSESKQSVESNNEKTN